MNSNSLKRLIGLVQETRLRKASRGNLSPLIATESDKGRVVNSSAFRRLQQKAQVFPLDTNAAVRTRLTHSIEVAQIGRYLAQKVIEKQNASSYSYAELAAFVNTVETACLLHDIGNPPFGHLGEAAIREWFKDRRLPDCDLQMFDGNPQGFRVISMLSGQDAYGMNLTCSLLLSTIKYPWTVARKPAQQKKIGIFDMDWSTYEEACAVLKWVPGTKFPFVRLLEAADDIAYSMSDLEDGLEKEIIRVEDLQGVFGAQRFQSSNVHPIVAFKASITNQAVDFAAEAFSKSLSKILDGEDVELLPQTSEIGGLLETIHSYARERIYSDYAAESVELAGRSVISGLLGHFKPLLDLDEVKFSALAAQLPKSDKGFEFQARLCKRLPKAYREKYALTDRGEESLRRAHLIVDFISGMTDDFALNTFQLLHGIRIQ
jgi:dGTPase